MAQITTYATKAVPEGADKTLITDSYNGSTKNALFSALPISTAAQTALDLKANALGSDDNYVTDAEKTKISGIEASADVTDAGNIASSIVGTSAKTTPVDADEVGLIDSAASSALKKLSWANIKATLKTYFDPLYAVLAGVLGGQTLKGGTDVTDILKLQGTSGNGTLTAPSVQVLVGNDGATVAVSVLNNGNVEFQKNTIAAGATSVVRLKGYTVDGLSAITAVQGDEAFCTDLLLPAFLAVAVGGGAVVGKVFYNGTQWTT